MSPLFLPMLVNAALLVGEQLFIYVAHAQRHAAFGYMVHLRNGTETASVNTVGSATVHTLSTSIHLQKAEFRKLTR